MGYDKIPTGGRHPDTDCEGASIIGLLDRFLQKDFKVRITLDQVKVRTLTRLLSSFRMRPQSQYSIHGSQMYPWILNDLDDPQKWLQMTSPATKINVSVREASGAMSAVHFRWRWGNKIAKHITSVFRNVRPIHRSPLDVGIKSDPQHVVDASPQQNRRDKGKWKATEPSKPPRSKATKILIENESQSSRGISTSYAGSQTSVARACRGSDANLLGRQVSPSTSKSASEKRSRFGLFLNWRPTKFQSPPTSPSSSFSQSMSPRTLGTVSGGNPNSRRSEEALWFMRNTQSSEDDEGGRLTNARRASSWGQGDKELHEVVSVTSIERELNDHDMNVGAGGVSRDGDFGTGVAGSSSFQLFDSILGPGSTSVRQETFADVNERYGRPFYDEDSSTLASGPGDDDDWQRGSEFDEDDADDADADDDDDDDALDSDQENGVTFSPRRRHFNLDE
jgi:SNF1-activating kinase 1